MAADTFEQAFHRIANPGHCGVEGGLVRARWLAEAAHLSHELQGRR
jgi:hypothetical protein